MKPHGWRVAIAYVTKWVVRLAYAHEDARYLMRARHPRQRKSTSARMTRARLAEMCRKLADRRLR